MRQLLLIILMIIFSTSTVLADNIGGRLGLTGKAGVLMPLKNDFISGTSESKTGFAAGGGLIYGINSNFAAELDITHVPSLDVEISGSKAFEASITDLSLGIQYRFMPEKHLVPFIGAGVDFIKGDLEHVAGNSHDLDWTAGGHVNAGVDYFVTRGIALTADFKGIFAAAGDIKTGSIKVGEYDPTSFVGTFGVRLFLPVNFY